MRKEKSLSEKDAIQPDITGITSGKRFRRCAECYFQPS